MTAAGSSKNDEEGGRVLVRGKEARFREEKRKRQGRVSVPLRRRPPESRGRGEEGGSDERGSEAEGVWE